jgi:hypothetical protein
MKDRQVGEILVDLGKCATEVRGKLEDIVCCVTKTAAITLQCRNSKHPSLPPNKSLILPDAGKSKYEL